MISVAEILKNTNIKQIVHLENVDSSNDYAKEISKLDFRDKLLVVADTQSKGKGRMGKTFFSPKSGLYFSLVIKPNLSFDEIQLITLTAAVALNNTINDLFHIGSKIKWLNDIYVGQKKLSGILAEGVISSSSLYDFVIVGVGINLESPPYLPQNIQHTFTALDEHTNLKVDRSEILITFINNFETLIQNLTKNKNKLIEEYKDSCMVLNQKVNIKNENEIYTAIDINSMAHLVVMNDQGKIKALNSGEISIEFNKTK